MADPLWLHGQRWTVVGARGWIGAALVASLQRAGASVSARSHGDAPAGVAGHVVWCSGVAHGADGAPRPSFRAHVIAIEGWLDAPEIASFTYLSSTRLYDLCDSTNEDTDLILRHDAIYAMTKAAGEALVIAAAPGGRVVRLSNVYGSRPESPLFLNDVLRQAALGRRVRLHTSLDSAKDYVGLDETLEVLPRIALAGRERIYNLAAGRNTTNGEIVAALQHNDPTIELVVDADAPRRISPPVAVTRIQNEFGFAPRPLIDAIPDLYRDACAYFERAGRVPDSH